MPACKFEFGTHAVVRSEDKALFHARKQALINDTKPASLLESLLVEELLHAQWGLYRVNAASARAAAQSLTVGDESVSAPCADISKIPARKPATIRVGEMFVSQLFHQELQ